jgi:hypothetical protein
MNSSWHAYGLNVLGWICWCKLKFFEANSREQRQDMFVKTINRNIKIRHMNKTSKPQISFGVYVFIMTILLICKWTFNGTSFAAKFVANISVLNQNFKFHRPWRFQAIGFSEKKYFFSDYRKIYSENMKVWNNE